MPEVQILNNGLNNNQPSQSANQPSQSAIAICHRNLQINHRNLPSQSAKSSCCSASRLGRLVILRLRSSLPPSFTSNKNGVSSCSLQNSTTFRHLSLLSSLPPSAISLFFPRFLLLSRLKGEKKRAAGVSLRAYI